MIRNLEVVAVHPQDNILLVKGGLPGARESLVTVYNREKGFASRFRMAEEEKKAQAQTEKKEEGKGENKSETQSEKEEVKK
jgi:hypothetical protein